VPAGALGIARGKQHNSDGWVERRHAGSAPAAAAARARDQDSAQAEDKDSAQAEDKGAQAQ